MERKKRELKHFVELSEGSLEQVVGGLNTAKRPGCPSTVEVTKNCKTTKDKENWAIATLACA